MSKLDQVHESRMRLEAAAPDLLAALKLLLSDCGDCSAYAAIEARKAIAKAEGR